MLDPLFMDASAWTAIVIRDDEHHRAAKTVYQRSIREGSRLLTTNWTLYEALSLVKAKVGHVQASALWRLVISSPVTRLVRVTEDIEASAVDLFFAYRDKQWGVVDCASFIVMEHLLCFRALAFDRHFREAGRQRGFTIVPDAP